MRRVAAIAPALLLLGCTGPSGTSVQPQDARQLLDQAVQYSLNGNYGALCDLAADRDRCQQDLKGGLQAKVPNVAPAIACTYELPEKKNANGRITVSGGQVLVVQGTDGEGRPFETAVFIFRDGRRLAIQNVIWWSGMGIQSPDPGQPTPTSPEPGNHDCP